MTDSTLARPRHRRAALMAGAVAISLSLVGAAPAFAAPSLTSVTLELTPSPVTVGETVTATATLVATADVFAYEVVFSFNDDLFEYVDDSATGPAGGFDAVTEGAGTVTLTHTRLGTSPSLAGDIELTADFAAIGDGDTSIDISLVTLVDSESASTPITEPASTDIVVEPDVTANPSPSPSPSSSTAPTGDDDGGPLAFTGSTIAGNIAIIVAAALAALALGVVLVRRRMTSTR